jgi:hypothetical protein
MLEDRSHQPRALAEKCLAIAKQTADESIRTSLLEMAQRWLDLADFVNRILGACAPFKC